MVAQLVADYETGAPSTKLMQKYHLGKGSVLNLLRSQGAKLRSQGLSESDLPEAIASYEACWSLKHIGAQFDCNAETVRKELHKAGVAIRKPHDGPFKPTSCMSS
jgi:hypothetical protein